MSNITTKYFSKKVAQTFISELANNVYYFAIGRYLPWTDENNPDTAFDTTKAINDFKRTIIAGKRIKPTDILNLVNRHNWISGTTYAQYDDTDPYMYSKAFYVVNSTEKVYKCLFNNYGAPSTSEPTLQQTDKFQLADGYIWKFMYALSSANNTKFSSGSYIPVEPNTAVSAAASNGSIDIILNTNPGSGYTGYISGSVKAVLSNTLFQIESTSGALDVDNFYYNSSAFYVINGTGEGQLTVISNYVVNSAGHFVYTQDALNSPVLDLTSEYRIAPQVQIYGDGSGAKAICTVNAIASYSIDTISVVSPGTGYSYANVAIVANPSYGSGAVARAIIPPEGGHGYDVATELGSKLIGFSTFLVNSESNTISTEVSFRQGALVRAPSKFTAPAAYYTFNANSGVSNTNDVIYISNANTNYRYGDSVQYIVDAGNTAVSGLANGSFYYVNFSNTTALSLSTTIDGTSVNLTSGVSETGHRLYTTNTFSSNTFNALTILSISTGVSTLLKNEVVTGLTSNSQAYVAFANSTVAKVSMINGNFQANSSFGETLLGSTSGVSVAINPNGINNSDIQPFSFKVMHLDNIEYIQRSNVDNEQGYLIVTI